MKRKLFSTLLCAFALLLLMGAGVEQDSAAAAIVIEEESASADGSAQVLETGIQTGIEAQDTEEISADEIYLEAIKMCIRDSFTLRMERGREAFRKEEIRLAEERDIPAWMELMRLVIDGYPAMDEGAYLEQRRESIRAGHALVLGEGDTLAGALALSLIHI